MPDAILVTRKPPGAAIERLRDGGDVWVWPHDREIDHDVLTRRVVDADGLYCMLTDRIDEGLLAAAPRLRVVSTMAVGVDNIDLAACRRRGIAVGHTPDVLTDSTADMAWALLMAASRRLVEGVGYVKEGSWHRWEPTALLGLDVSHSTLGIIGMGRVGRAIARRSQGFDMQVIYTSRSQAADIEEELGVERVPLDDLLARSDHIVVCLPLDSDTRGLIDAAAFARMKPTVTLVNIARGPIVDTDALYNALVSGQIRGAGLDVTDPEPIPPDHPLMALANCTIVPHVGSATERTRIAMADLAADNLTTGLAGEPMPARIV